MKIRTCNFVKLVLHRLYNLWMTMADTCNSGTPDPIDDLPAIFEIIVYTFRIHCHRWLPRRAEKDRSWLLLTHSATRGKCISQITLVLYMRLSNNRKPVPSCQFPIYSINKRTGDRVLKGAHGSCVQTSHLIGPMFDHEDFCHRFPRVTTSRFDE